MSKKIVFELIISEFLCIVVEVSEIVCNIFTYEVTCWR